MVASAQCVAQRTSCTLIMTCLGQKAERLLPKPMFNFFALGIISENGIGSYKLLILVLGKLSSRRRNNDLVIIDGLRKLGSTKSRSVLADEVGNAHENEATDFHRVCTAGSKNCWPPSLHDKEGDHSIQ